jgi:hypothetical protein
MGVDPWICQTFAASPAEPGELPFWFRVENLFLGLEMSRGVCTKRSSIGGVPQLSVRRRSGRGETFECVAMLKVSISRSRKSAGRPNKYSESRLERAAARARRDNIPLRP